MKLFRNNHIRGLAMLLLAAIPAGVSAADLNVRGKVLTQGSGKPLEGVVIVDLATDLLLGTTNAFGEYSITADENTTLQFEVLGCKDLQEPVKGRIEINVSMFPEAEMLQEVVVTGKSQYKGLVLPPADLILEGNDISLKTTVTIPHQLFSSSARMIIQPAIYNVTTRTVNYLKPVVFDGFRYNATQHRMLDWDASKDPLNDFVHVKKTSRRADDTIFISDKLRVENPHHDFMCVVISSMEDYNRIIYADTTRIARGTVNPLRFLSYSLNGVVMTDENYIPKPEVQLRDASGQVRLVFALGSPKLDLSMGDNTAEMNKMLREFEIIQSDPDMTLKSFTIVGTASPEGPYAVNKKLADSRMHSALDKIMAAVPEAIRRNARIIYDSNVAGWSEVEKLLRADGLTSEADAVKAVIAANAGNIDRQTRAMRALPFYKTTLLEDYLPRLRKVEYRIVSSKYRPLTESEIAELYNKDYRTLSPYHFWKLYTESADTARREEIMRRALEIHPEFITAASDLTALTIDCERADDSILKPFAPDMADVAAVRKFPLEARYNLAVASMAGNHYSYADSLLYDMPDDARFHKAKMYCAALNGRYASVLQEIAEESPLNEVLMLLALHNNSRAYEKSRQLGESAEEEYVKAIAANRMADADAANGFLYLEASTHLANAIRKKPELLDIARIDGDVIDLLDEDGNLPDDELSDKE